MRTLTRMTTQTITDVTDLTEVAAALEAESRTWDEYALRQRLVAVHAAAQEFRADLARQFPSDLVPRRLVEAVEDAADGLGEALARLDAVHYDGLHRREDVAADAALCQYRDDAEAIHGYGHRGLHRTRRRARLAAEPRRVVRHSNGGAL